MVDYFGAMINGGDSKYTTPNKRFTYEQSSYALDDLIRKNSGQNCYIKDLAKTCFNLMYEFLSHEHENTNEIFDMTRFSSFLYTKTVGYVFGDKLDGIVLEEDLYDPPYIVENTVQKKRKNVKGENLTESADIKNINAVESNNEIDDLRKQVASMSAMLSSIAEGLNNNAKPKQQTKRAGAKLPANSASGQGDGWQLDDKFGDTGTDGGNS